MSKRIKKLIELGTELGFSKVTLDKLEALNIPDVEEMSATKIKKLRVRFNVSQGVFAKLLNVSSGTVKKWEQGEAVPSGAALKLLNIAKEKGVEALMN